MFFLKRLRKYSFDWILRKAVAGQMWKLLKLFIYVFLIATNGGFATSEETIETQKEKNTLPPESDNHVLKRYDQEYQTCLENFDIHKDKIIRTQDSREMGAKYINEFDLNSRDECLRACCGTDSCDVFVFEEKNPGSCYLFHCGPPDDFKCKFTKHHNYTSAVLAPNRRLSELENQIKHTKHEQELTQLRKSEVTAQSTGTPYVSTTIVVPESAKDSLQLASSTNNNLTTSRRCSAYQFECRGSGECIAIYNACDGIPQCADGSDEAPELDCPTQGNPIIGTTLPPPPPPTHPSVAPQPIARVLPPEDQNPVRGKYMKEEPSMGSVNLQLSNQPNIPLEGQRGPPGYNGGGQGVQYKQQDPREWQQQLPQPPQPLPKPPPQPRYPVQQSNPQNIGNQEKTFTPGLNQQLPGKMYSMEGENQQNYNIPWTSYQHGPTGPYQGPGNRQYEDGNSHIFSHKGNGLVADSDSPPNQFSDTSHNDFSGKYGGNNGGNTYYNNAPYRPPQPPNTWQPNQQQQAHDTNPMQNMGAIQHNENSRKMMLPPDYYYEDNQSTVGRDTRFRGLGMHDTEFPDPGLHHQEARPYPHQPPQKSEADPPPYQTKMEQQPRQRVGSSLESKMEKDPSPTLNENKGRSEVHVKTEKPAHHHDHEVTTAESRTKSNENIKKRVEVKEKAKERMSENESVIIEAMDDEVPKPTGAILSLALGLCITGLLVTLVGCRVRGIRKRLRRGSKSPYAHDADYLVNGMYL